MVMKIVPSNKSILLVSHWHCISYVFQGFEVDFFVHDRGETPRFVGTSHLLPPAEDCSIHVKRAPIIGLNHRPIGEVKGFDTYSSSFLSGLLWLITVLHIKKYCDCPKELAVLTARLFMIRGGTPAIWSAWEHQHYFFGEEMCLWKIESTTGRLKSRWKRKSWDESSPEECCSVCSWTRHRITALTWSLC